MEIIINEIKYKRKAFSRKPPVFPESCFLSEIFEKILYPKNTENRTTTATKPPKKVMIRII
jgi:hypothetical protein